MSEIARHPRLAMHKGAHRRLQAGHPWVYSNEIALDAAAKSLAAGTVVTITDAGGTLLATAHFNAHTLIAARVLARAGDVALNADFYAARLGRALQLRARLFARPFYRLVHAEADGLPGLIIDRFDDVYVVQPNTAGMQASLAEITTALTSLVQPRAIVMRGDTPARGQEGLQEEVRLLSGALDGPVTVEENGALFRADVLSGQKTGWFFDQRDNHAFIAGLAKNATVLDLYTHTGGFAIPAARAGATKVTAVDSSQTALDLAAAALPLNDVAGRVECVRSDVFDFLEAAATRGEAWGVVIADPPPFVRSRKDLKAGLQGYRKLARLCAKVTAPGGILFVASCSHNAPTDEFTAAVVRGVADAGRSGAIIHSAGAGADHPIHPMLPESAYLKAVVLALD
jgi:23S rRNA (cytosine1962-C5)-methyltransferase